MLLNGYYGKCNSGDDALAYVCISQLCALADARYLVEVLSDDRIEHNCKFKNISADVSKRFQRFRSYLSSKVIVFGGGGIFQDHRKTGLIDLRQKYLLVTLAKMLGRQIVFIGISVGPITTREGFWLTKKILNTAKYITVRDQCSYDFLVNRLKIRRDLEKTFDLAVLLNRDETLSGVVKKPKMLGISLVPVKDSSIYRDQRKFLSNLAMALVRIIDEHGVKIRMIEFNRNSGDLEIMNQLSSLIDRKQSISVVPYSRNPVNVARQVAQCSYFLAMRLHSAIFSYMTDTPFVLINYHQKCEGFAHEIGLEPERLIISDDKAEFLFKLDRLINSTDKGFLRKLEDAEREALKSFDGLKNILQNKNITYC